MIAPIKMSNFRKEGDKWVYDKVEGASTELLKSITDDANKEHIINNLNEYIEQPQVLEGTADNIIERVKKTFEEWFPDYGNSQMKTDEEIRNIIKKQKIQRHISQ